MSKVSTCWWGDNAWNKRLLKSADLRSQMWHWAFCPPVGHRQVQHNFTWIGLFSRNSRKSVLLKVVCTLVWSVCVPFWKGSQQRLWKDGGWKGGRFALMLRIHLRGSLLSLSQHPNALHPLGGSWPSAWAQLGLVGSLHRLEPTPLSWGTEWPLLPALQGDWHFDFPYSQGIVICNAWKEEWEDFAPLSFLCWFWWCGMAAAGSVPPALLREQCHLLVPWDSSSWRGSRSPGPMWVPNISPPVLPNQWVPGVMDNTRALPVPGLGALRGACNGINSHGNNHWKATNSLWTP